MPPKRPVMRYYGGKFRLAPDIVRRMPEHEIYVEPFGGAASVLLCKPRAACEVYNDLDHQVVNVFRMLRDCPEALLRGLILTPYAREEYELAYEPTRDPIEAARRFIFRSCAGIGSDSSNRLNGFRVSLNDQKNVTSMAWANLPAEMAHIVERLRGIVIENTPAVSLMDRFDGKSTLWYLDPPYVLKSRKRKDKGYVHEMTDEDHSVLLQHAKALKGKVIISGYASKLYDHALRGWHRETLGGQRDQTNDTREEVLWSNFKPHDFLL
jgi:DNA adenine methylase